MKRVTLTAFIVCAAWLSFGQTARFGDLNRNSVVVTSAPPQSVVSVNGQTGAVEITAAQIGALTNETDEAALAALAAYAAYWPPNATASSWFTFVTNSGAITITGYNIAGGVDVVIPDYINGWPVTEIGGSAFMGSSATSIGGAGNVVTVGNSAFEFCTSLTSVLLPQVQTVGDYAFGSCFSLTSVSLPQVQTVGDYAFYYCASLTSVLLPQVQTVGDSAFTSCASLTSVSLPQVQTVGDSAFGGCGGLTSLYFDNDTPTIGFDIFMGITPNQVTNYVTNAQATGWGAIFAGGMPVVRPTLSADAIYQAGELVATTGHVAQASLADADGYTTQMVMRVGSEIATNRWGPRVTLPDGIVTNGTASDVVLGDLKFSGSSISSVTDPNRVHMVFFGGTYFINTILCAAFGGNYDAPSVVSYGKDGGAEDLYQGFSHRGGPQVYQVKHDGSLITSNNVTAYGTNTAAEVRSLGGYSIFDSGSNCYWRVTASNGTFYASDTNGVRKFKFTTETP